MDFDTLWNTAVALHNKLGKKGDLVLSGASPKVEVCYVYYDDFVPVASGLTATAAVTACVEKLQAEAQAKAIQIRAEADRQLAALVG